MPLKNLVTENKTRRALSFHTTTLMYIFHCFLSDSNFQTCCGRGKYLLTACYLCVFPLVTKTFSNELYVMKTALRKPEQ